MSARMRTSGTFLAAVVALATLSACSTIATAPKAQGISKQPTNSTPNYVGTEFSRAELEQMLAPVALYPNDVLGLVLLAATAPDDVLAAAEWSRGHSELDGDAAIDAGSKQGWDPAVTALLAFPQILEMLSEQIDWTRRLGDIVLAQSADVSLAIRDLRRRSVESGVLEGVPDNLYVFDGSGDVFIDSGFKGYYYIPTCNSSVAYGTWPWPDYPPADSNGWIRRYYWVPCTWDTYYHVDRRVFAHSYRNWHKHHQHDPAHPCPPRSAVAWKHVDHADRHAIAYATHSNAPRNVDASPLAIARPSAWAPRESRAARESLPPARYSSRESPAVGARPGSVFHFNGALGGGRMVSASSGGSPVSFGGSRGSSGGGSSTHGASSGGGSSSGSSTSSSASTSASTSSSSSSSGSASSSRAH